MRRERPQEPEDGYPCAIAGSAEVGERAREASERLFRYLTIVFGSAGLARSYAAKRENKRLLLRALKADLPFGGEIYGALLATGAGIASRTVISPDES